MTDYKTKADSIIDGLSEAKNFKGTLKVAFGWTNLDEVMIEFNNKKYLFDYEEANRFLRDLKRCLSSGGISNMKTFTLIKGFIDHVEECVDGIKQQRFSG